VTSMELPWTSAGLALAVGLFISWMLDRLIRSRALHGLLAACSLAGAFAANEYLRPWDSSSLWLKALGPCLVLLAAIESSQAIWSKRNRNAA
jgi:hypothetical protein